MGVTSWSGAFSHRSCRDGAWGRWRAGFCSSPFTVGFLLVPGENLVAEAQQTICSRRKREIDPDGCVSLCSRYSVQSGGAHD